MVPDGQNRASDLLEVQSRRDTLAAGTRLAVVMFGAALAYATATISHPNRPAIALLFGGLVATSAVLYGFAHVWIDSARPGGAVTYAWGVVSVAVIAVAVHLDGGSESPLALLFFLPVLFAAMSYPLTATVMIGGVSELALVAVGSASADPIRLAFLATALAMAAVLCAWQSQLADRRRRELARMSRSDALTGCLNRRGFHERLEAELDQSLRTGRPFALVMLDLDGFKQVNDNLGHAAGDDLLRWTVRETEQVIRPMDALGRLGGDEFVALLPGTGEGDAHEVAKRIQKALVERVGATTGIATFPADGLEAEELIEHADSELYTAREGRPRTMPTRRELSWASTLARAVDLRMQLAVAAEDSKRVAALAGAIGERLGWDGHELSLLRMAANLHDVGKVSLPDHLLLEPAQLSEEERAQLERHPIIGSELVGRVEGLEPLVPWIRHSHEHFDGSGYPDGLRGDAIPPAARILRVADAFDSLTSGRSRGEKLSPEAALDVLRGDAGGAFDPACVAALEQHAAEPSALGAALAE